MRRSRILAVLAMLAALSACGGPSPHSTSTPTPTENPCRANTDSARPELHPLVQVSPTSAASPSTIAGTVRLTCEETLSVQQAGSASAKFGSALTCLLTKGPSTTGILLNGDPVNAFFTLGAGEVVCVVNTPAPHTIPMCGNGVLYLTGQSSFGAACSSHRVFKVAVHTGLVSVHYPTGTKPVPAGYQLSFDFSTGVVQRHAFKFGTAELATLAAEAGEMGLELGGT